MHASACSTAIDHGDHAGTINAERLRESGFDWIVLIGLCLWMLYAVNGFRRVPWEPIELSDADVGSGLRQVLFSGVGAMALRRLVVTGMLGHVLVMRLPVLLVGLFMLASLLWSQDAVLTVKRSIIYLLGFIALITIVHLPRCPMVSMQRTIVYFCGGSAWLSLFAYVALPKFCSVNPARPGLAGISQHPNTLGAVLAVGCVLSLGMTAIGREKTLLRLNQIGMVIAIIMAQSMTSLSMLMVSGGIFLVLASKPYRRGAIQVAAVIVVLVILAHV